jgi:hypothetical protein
VVNHTWVLPTQPISYIYDLKGEFIPDSLGIYSFTLLVRDNEGNIGIDEVNVSVIPRIPVIQVLQDIGAEPLFGITDVTGTANGDAPILEVNYSIDNGDWRPAEGTNNWMLRLNTTLLTNGPHTLTIRVWDGYSFTDTEPIGFTVLNSEDQDPGPDDSDGGPSDIFLPIAIGLLIAGILGFFIFRRQQSRR